MAKHRPMAPYPSTAEYDAFSPDGTKIIGTLEILLGEKAIRYFVREDDAFIHEWGDDYRDYEPETVHVGGKVVYVDTALLMWTEEALTYRARGTNRVVRKGRHQPPVVLPELNFALTLGHRAEVLIREVISPTAEMPSWSSIKASARLDAVGEATLLHRFIERMGLGQALAAFAAVDLAQAPRIEREPRSIARGVPA